GECCRSGVDSAHLLSSRTKTAGTFQSCAMFNASWNVPMFVAPSPKNATATRGSPRSWNASAMPVICGRPPPTTAFAPRFPRSTSYRCIEPPYPCEQPSSFPYSSAISSFGAVPFASVCPCARCVDAITSPSSSARQTPTATASCPIATCRKPGRSPARKRSSTFSSNRRISSISRKKSRSSSFESVPFCSTLATATESMLRPLALADDFDRLVGTSEAAPADVRTRHEPLARQWQKAIAGLPSDWTDIYAEVRFTSTDYLERAALLMAPCNPARYGGPNALRFRCARAFGYGVSPEMARRCLARCDEEGITGEVEILRALSDTYPVATQRPVWYVGGRAV